MRGLPRCKSSLSSTSARLITMALLPSFNDNPARFGQVFTLRQTRMRNYPRSVYVVWPTSHLSLLHAFRSPDLLKERDAMSTRSSSKSENVTHDVEDVLQPVPESARTTKLSGQFWIWAGANVAPINWILGALGIQLGLGLADTMIVLVLGNLIGMVGFGFFVLLGQKTGATGMLLARGAFGRRGAYLPAAIQAIVAVGWSALNTWVILDLVMALFGMIGWVDPTQSNLPWKVAIAAVIMTVQVAICYRGYSAIAKFERITM